MAGPQPRRSLPQAAPLPQPAPQQPAIQQPVYPQAGPQQPTPVNPYNNPAVPPGNPVSGNPGGPVIVTNPSGAATSTVRRKRPGSDNTLMIWGIIGFVLVAALSAVVAMMKSGSSEVAQRPPKVVKPADPTPASTPKVDTSIPAVAPKAVEPVKSTVAAPAKAPVETVPADPEPDSVDPGSTDDPAMTAEEQPSDGDDSETESSFGAVTVKPGGATDMAAEPVKPGKPKPIGGPGPDMPEDKPEGLSFEKTDRSEEELVDAMMAIYNEKKLLDKKSYPAIRKLFADRFAELYKNEIQSGLGASAEDALAWLEQHPAVREELFTAISPETDKIPQVLANFEKLRKEFPEKIDDYAELAIACCVVWDDPNRGVYNYAGHQRRTHSTMPDDLAQMTDVFRYYVEAEKFMEGRIRHVPWELLAYVVNDRTPIAERKWAMTGYAGQRAMYGKCYSEVPYDHEMLRTQSRECKLGGKEYTLANIKQYGGVCAMQADFAARVGKGIGIPAAYVGGESAGGELHAWVMWVELKQATPTGLQFTLESHGRYRGDKYYVGKLDDAQSGLPITDRQLELRLQTVGLDVVAKRQTTLVMKVWPQIREKAALDVPGGLKLLGDAIKLCPGNEAAWSAVAALSKENAGNKKYAKMFDGALNKLFTTFARVPDYTLELFDDLSAYQSDSAPRIKLYSQLVQLYENAGRPDLACEARLKLAEIQVKAGKKLDAINGLAFTVAKFPSEGRYVPKLLDQIETLAEGEKGADKAIVALYQDILSRVKQMRGSDPSPWALKLFDRGISVFQKYGQAGLAQAAIAQQQNIREGRGKPDKGEES